MNTANNGDVNPKVKFTITKKQAQALRTLSDRSVEELLYGGAKGGGKTIFGCIWSYLQAKKIIKNFKLKPAKFPLVVGFMGRKQSVDFNTTTLETWKRFIPSDAYELKKAEKLIVIEKAVAIRYGGLDDSDTVNKFNSAEFGFFFLDQAEECTEEDVGLLRGTLRLKVDNLELDYKALLTANPAICWLKPAFITTPQPKTKFIQALPTDNPFLPSGYVNQLKKAFAFKPELLKAYLEGSWDDLDSASVVIPYRDVMKNVDNDQYDKTHIKRLTFADVSDEGDDETVIYDFENTKIVDSEIYSHRSLMDTCGRIQSHARKNRSSLIGVDKVGLGAGLLSRLYEVYEDEKDIVVYGYDGRVKAKDPDTFANHKAESWWRAAELFAERICDIPNDPVLISQLSSVTYHFKSNEKIALDSKEDLKEKMRHSPDRAEAYVMGLDALEHTPLYKPTDRYARHRGTNYRYKLNPNTV